jgi:hypothetical protein
MSSFYFILPLCRSWLIYLVLLILRRSLSCNLRLLRYNILVTAIAKGHYINISHKLSGGNGESESCLFSWPLPNSSIFGDDLPSVFVKIVMEDNCYNASRTWLYSLSSCKGQYD